MKKNPFYSFRFMLAITLMTGLISIRLSLTFILKKLPISFRYSDETGSEECRPVSFVCNEG